MRRLPSLNAVRAFEAAGRHLSFNRAADELAITPSAVSHQVKALEEGLGVPLFRRLNRRVALTDEGAAYLPAVSAALDQIAVATDRVAAAGVGGPLTMSLAPSFQQAHPEIEVRVISTIESSDFETTDIDVAVRFGTGNWPGLKSILILREELVPVCSPALLDKDHPLETPEDLANFNLIQTQSRAGEWRQWLTAAGVTGIDAERGPRFQHVGLAIRAAEAGVGVAIADRGMLETELATGSLVAPLDIELINDSAFYLVYPTSYEERPKVAAFRDWLLSEIGETASPHDEAV